MAARNDEVGRLQHGLDAEREQLAEVKVAGVSSGPISTSLLQHDRPLVEPLGRAEDRDPVRVAPWIIGQWMELGPRWRGSKEG